jgi:hypothetical protein
MKKLSKRLSFYVQAIIILLINRPTQYQWELEKLRKEFNDTNNTHS